MGYQIASVLSALINAYCMVIFAWVILSWFQSANKLVGDIYKALGVIVSPYVNLFRRFLPTAGGLDFSPFVALILLQLVGRFLVNILASAF